MVESQKPIILLARTMQKTANSLISVEKPKAKAKAKAAAFPPA
jgi:hypothetical protein